MKKIISIILVIVLLSANVFLVSCGSSKNSLKGDYVHEDGTIIRFYDNGQFFYPQSSGDSRTIKGTYEIFNGSQGTMHFKDQYLGEWKTEKFTISKDKKQIMWSNGDIYQKK